MHTWASEGGQGKPRPPRILKFSAKKVVFLVLSGKNQISPLLCPPGKILEKSHCGLTPGKNPSDAHACMQCMKCFQNLKLLPVLKYRRLRVVSAYATVEQIK